jgi:hypothetical protein
MSKNVERAPLSRQMVFDAFHDERAAVAVGHAADFIDAEPVSAYDARIQVTARIVVAH